MFLSCHEEFEPLVQVVLEAPDSYPPGRPPGERTAQDAVGPVGENEERAAAEPAVVDQHRTEGERSGEEEDHGRRGGERDAGQGVAEQEGGEAGQDEEEQGEVGEEGLHQGDEDGASRGDALLGEQVHAHGEARQAGTGDEIVDRIGDERDAEPVAKGQVAARGLRDVLVRARHRRIGKKGERRRQRQHARVDAGRCAQQLASVREQHG